MAKPRQGKDWADAGLRLRISRSTAPNARLPLDLATSGYQFQSMALREGPSLEACNLGVGAAIQARQASGLVLCFAHLSVPPAFSVPLREGVAAIRHTCEAASVGPGPRWCLEKTQGAKGPLPTLQLGLAVGNVHDRWDLLRGRIAGKSASHAHSCVVPCLPRLEGLKPDCMGRPVRKVRSIEEQASPWPFARKS